MNGKSLDNQLIHDAIEYISALFKNAHDGHDAEHSLRVYRTALMLAEKETEVDMEVLALAALLHDADDHKLFATKNNENAKKVFGRKAYHGGNGRTYLFGDKRCVFQHEPREKA